MPMVGSGADTASGDVVSYKVHYFWSHLMVLDYGLLNWRGHLLLEDALSGIMEDVGVELGLLEEDMLLVCQ